MRRTLSDLEAVNYSSSTVQVVVNRSSRRCRSVFLTNSGPYNGSSLRVRRIVEQGIKRVLGGASVVLTTPYPPSHTESSNSIGVIELIVSKWYDQHRTTRA